MCGVVAGHKGQRAVSDEVSGKQDKVGGKGIDFADDVLEEEGLGELVEVDVAELHDAITVKGVGEVGDGDGAIDDLEFVAGDFASVQGHTCCDGACTDEEVASSKTRRLIGLRTGHKS